MNQLNPHNANLSASATEKDPNPQTIKPCIMFQFLCVLTSPSHYLPKIYSVVENNIGVASTGQSKDHVRGQMAALGF
jgi:hypothetical protein